MANYLITGGAGFIGINYLEKALKKKSNDIYICLDKLTYASNIFKLNEFEMFNNFKFIKGCICDVELVDNIFQTYKIDIIINFAAETHVDRSIDDSLLFFQTNVMGVQVLLDACRKYGIKRFHQISTDEVYGDVSLDSISSHDECSKLKPSNPYSASKAAADLLVLSYYRTYNIPVTISRASNNYGPYQNVEKFVPKVITNAVNDINIPIYGDGTNIRNWLHVYDHCSAIELIINKGKEGNIYNIASNDYFSNIEIVKKITSFMNVNEELIVFVADRLGHDKKYSINFDKIKNQLKWSPVFSFDTSIHNIITWYTNRRK